MTVNLLGVFMKVLSGFLSVLFILSAPAAWAYSIDKVSYQRSSQTVFVTLSFEGGKKKHEFSPLFDPCVKDTNPFQLAVRLVDTGWDDTGTDSFTEVVPVDLSGADCSPAEVTVFISNRHATFLAD